MGDKMGCGTISAGGRKYGVGGYGVGSYDLGPPVMHPWIPIIPIQDAPVPPPSEPWVPVPIPVYQSLET